MEIRFYPLNEKESFAINLRLHATELLALHYDKKEIFKNAFLEKIIKETQNEAEKLLERKIPENV